ncbi:hypothetical protein Krac_12331 [Ktedonobacter racemifer DSM 44963]|uniref:Uncharacterized protein n=1 Tax=Ktedonobacter racemifer DSM 44963 TaxID=485913 RepID=D6TGI6_KTERA|nr:hypothetical protein Krac_12331 [Ktedonobacter racemifer DSM 44963]
MPTVTRQKTLSWQTSPWECVVGTMEAFSLHGAYNTPFPGERRRREKLSKGSHIQLIKISGVENNIYGT